jgi:periplasmic protein CpxP/Spy
MKTSYALSLSLISAGLVLSLASARADDPSNPPVPPPAPASPDATPGDGGQTPPPEHHRRMRPAFVLGELTEKLGLTPDQQKTVGAIIADSDGQLKALRGDDSLSREDKRAKMRSIISTTRGQIRAALTPDQQKIFDTLPTRGERGGQGGQGGPAGQGGEGASPTPTPTS